MKDEDRFIKKFQVDLKSECWIWTTCTSIARYGKFKLNGVWMGSHRAAYILFIGPIPKGQNVLHTCDMPPCVNPEHLFLGTQSDNNQDAMKKGRHYGSRKMT